jgi:hypothetical protein
MNLVVQSFGRENEYRRATLAILSFIAYIKKPIDETKIFLFTDNPGYFESHLKGLPIYYILLTPEKIRQMRGAIDFLHRMKIALIEEAFSLTNGDLLYADSDAFFIADPSYWMDQVSEEQSFMHVHEYHFESLRNMELPGGKIFRDFLHLIESKNFVLADGRGLKITAKHSSWNAGVMLFHSSHKNLLPDVYALTEQFFPFVKIYASEQYAFSIILEENTKLKSCEQMVYHYWYRVKKVIADEFLSKKLTSDWAGLSLDKKIELAKEWTLQLPRLFESHVLSLKDNSVQELNKNHFRKGYSWALKAAGKGAMTDVQFIKDVLYHAKRQLTGK